MKIQIDVFEKSQDYNTAIPRQEKGQWAESELNEILDKR